MSASRAFCSRQTRYAVSSSSSVNGFVSVRSSELLGTGTAVTGLVAISFSRTHQPKKEDRLAR